MESQRSERRAAFMLGFCIRRLEHLMFKLFDATDTSFSVLEAFECNLDLIGENVSSLAETNERALVAEMDVLINSMRDLYGESWECLRDGEEPHLLTKHRAPEVARKIKNLCSLLTNKGLRTNALYQLGRAVTDAALLSAYGVIDENDGWRDTLIAKENLSEQELALADQQFELDRPDGSHLRETIGERCSKFGRGLSDLDAKKPVSIEVDAEKSACAEVETETSPAKEGKRRRLPNSLDERDQWIYDQCCAGKLYKNIVFDLKDHQLWDHLACEESVIAAANRFAKRKGLPKIPKRRGK